MAYFKMQKTKLIFGRELITILSQIVLTNHDCDVKFEQIFFLKNYLHLEQKLFHAFESGHLGPVGDLASEVVVGLEPSTKII